MNKKFQLLAASIVILITASCSSGGEKTSTSDAQDVKASEYDQIYVVNTDDSHVAWEGYKPTGTHDGIVLLSNGNLNLKGDGLTGGKFTLDMNTITVEDLQDPDKNARLTGHLKSADFFEVETYPTASFKITGIRPVQENDLNTEKEKGDVVPTHVISGNLIMKNISKNISFNAKVDMNDGMIKAETNQFFIDRVDWNVQYGSKRIFDDLRDNFVNDEIGIKIYLVAEPGSNPTAGS
ncbi:MAG: YceI family protein [Bacteroidales bacterium]